MRECRVKFATGVYGPSRFVQGHERMSGSSRHGINRREWSLRAREFCPRGEDLPHSRLTPRAVRSIRRSTEKHAVLARRYNVHINTIGKVKSYATWGHIA